MSNLTIRTKTFFAIACTMAFLIIVIGTSLHYFNLKNVQKVEQRFSQVDLLRAENLIKEKQYDLTVFAESWGSNDLTWQYARGDIETPPDAQMINYLQIDFFAILDLQNKSLYQQNFNGMRDYAADPLRQISQYFPQMSQRQNSDGHHSGLVLLGNQPLLVALHPVLPSSHELNSAGLLVVGRLLDAHFWQQINNDWKLNGSLFAIDNQPADSHKNIDAIHSRLIVNDINGQPAFILENDSPHSILNVTKKGFVFFLVLFILAAVVVVFTTQILLEKLVLSRLFSLKKRLKKVNGDDAEVVLVVEGNDEISDITRNINAMLERQREGNKIRHRQDQRFADMVEHSGLVVIAMDMKGQISLFNRSAEVVTGYERQDVLGKIFFDQFTTPEVASVLVDYIETAMVNGQFTGDFHAPLRIRNGEIRQLAWDAIFERDEEGALVNFIGFGRDITDSLAAEERLQMINKVFENSTEAIVITDSDNNIVEVNQAFCRRSGFSRTEVLGKNPRILKSERHEKEFFIEMWRQLLSVGHWEGEIWDTTKQGEDYAKWMVVDTIKDRDGSIKNFFAISTDITKIKDAESRLHHLAYYDSLTDLPNRLSFCDALEHRLQNCTVDAALAVIIFNLDSFKRFNETLGPVQADKLLKMVAERLGHCACSDVILARMGGDEFALLIERQHCQQQVQQLMDCMETPFSLGTRQVCLTTSIGIALAPQDGLTVTDLIKNADIALYSIKADSRNSYSYFHQTMNDRVTERMLLAEMLRDALANDELELYYQPKINLTDGTILGGEALLRWHSRDGMIPPDRFIPIAEETGLIIPIGEWVLREACRQVSEWRQSHGDIHIGVNISPAQFDLDYLPQLVADVLDESGLPASALELEITEGMIIQDVDKTVEILQSLRNLGVELSIDDFGTGYSSLSYLTRLPLDILKIDRSFMEKVPQSTDDTNVVLSILALARSLNMKVTAEGVETQQHVELLNANDCDYIQGYFSSRPIPAADFVKFMTHKQGRCGSCEGITWH